MSGPQHRPAFRSFVLSLLLVLFSAPVAPAGAQERGRDGFDYFQTVAAGSSADFRGDLALPAGFFDEGSPRFVGRVALKGAPLGRFRETETGNADCILERKGMPRLDQVPSRGSAQLELVALSLASVRPVQIKVGRQIQRWDVKVALSTGRASTGKIDVRRTSSRGGTFDSEFLVVPVFTFVRRGDGATRTLDVGKMRLSAATEKALTLRASGAKWSTVAPARAIDPEATFNPSVVGNVARQLRHFHSLKHEVILAARPIVRPIPN